MNDKSLLRRHIRSLDPGREARERESAAICAHILASPWYRAARVIGGYMPLAREADVTPVLLDALRAGKTLALPLCGDAPHMTLRHVASLEELVPGAYGIREPREDTEIITVDALDLLLVPLEGIDPRGMRLGKGGGYYDCLLTGQNAGNEQGRESGRSMKNRRSPKTMGCALSWQRVERIPAQPWDMSLTACAHQGGVDYYHK